MVLDGDKSYMQNKATNRKTRIYYEEGQRVMYLRLPSKEEEVREETEKALKGNRFAILATEIEIQQDFTRRMYISPHEDDQQGDKTRKEEE